MNVAPIVRAFDVTVAPETAWQRFTADIGRWWPLETHGMFGAESRTVEFVDTELVESGTDGRTTVWADVLTWDAPNRLVLRWFPGRSRETASEVDVSFAAVDGGTRVTLVHSGWASHEARADYAGPGSWGTVLDCYAGLADRDV